MLLMGRSHAAYPSGMSRAWEQKTTYDAPVGSVDLAAFDDDGTAYEIWPCDECLPWHAEVVVEEDYVFVREWHAVACARFQDLMRRSDD
jgi:hypothetical protein